MLPLDHVRILDLTRLAPGPHCTMILADFGADVVRIEEPGGGRRAGIERERIDETERDRRERRIAAFNALNRNKRSITLNLKVPQARDAFYRLADDADVVVEGFRPGVVKRLGVDYQTLSSRNPRLIYCSISGYGQDGPYRLLVGHDINYAAMAGALGIIGPADGPPSIPANLLGDYAGGGMHAAIGIMTALIARDRTGRGQYVDISMTDGVVNLLAAALSESYGNEEFVRRGRHRLTGGVPYYNVYECKDGRYLSIGANEPWFYDNFCTAIGRPDLAGTQADLARRQEIFKAFEVAIRTRTRDEWFALLRDQDICAAPVYDLEELEDDPQLQARKMIVELPHPEFGTVKQVGISVKLSDTPGSIRTTSAGRGEHTEQVLREAGLSESEIDRLRTTGGTA